jgi:hypothetical protein
MFGLTLEDPYYGARNGDGSYWNWKEEESKSKLSMLNTIVSIKWISVQSPQLFSLIKQLFLTVWGYITFILYIPLW